MQAVAEFHNSHPIFLNLIIAFTEPGGRLCVSLKNVSGKMHEGDR
jgi:hypothetical protein